MTVLGQFKPFKWRKLCLGVSTWPSLPGAQVPKAEAQSLYGVLAPLAHRGRSGLVCGLAEPQSLRAVSPQNSFQPESIQKSSLFSVFQSYHCHFDKGF